MRSKTKKPTVTIGICAFNEEKNIEAILASILKQKRRNFSLVEVKIMDDFSSDDTRGIVTKFAKTNRLIKLVSDNDRRGKAYRLNSLYKQTTSDILITFDADVALKNVFVLENIVTSFKGKDIGLVNGNVLPMPAETFVEKIIVTYEYFWREITNQINGGNNIFNSLGCLIALSKSFYESLEIPEKIVAEDHFIFLSAKKGGFKSKFAKNAIVYYRAPQNIRDYINQFSRYFSSHGNIEKYFGQEVEVNYLIPAKYKVKAYVKCFVKSPLLMFFAILLQVYQRVLFLILKKSDSNVWAVITSSK